MLRLHLQVGEVAHLFGVAQLFDGRLEFGDEGVAVLVERCFEYFGSRITSYNVCYTKLLRVESGKDGGGFVAGAVIDNDKLAPLVELADYRLDRLLDP